MEVEPIQLSLGVSLKDDATFNNFYAESDANKLALHTLNTLACGQEQHNHVIWGAPGSGLTHLLQAVCHESGQQLRTVQYIPVADVLGFDPRDLFDGMEHTSLLCLDGVDHICGNVSWEQALFHLFNRVRDSGHTLLVSSHCSPPSLPIVLPDLKSRVLGSVVYHIESLSDDDKKQALIRRASNRGFDLPIEVASFILSRASRDTNQLFDVLNRLDEASLQQQRKLTVPFAKEVLKL